MLRNVVLCSILTPLPPSVKFEGAQIALCGRFSNATTFSSAKKFEAYLKDVEDKAMSEFGKGLSSAGLNLGKSNGSSLFLSGPFSFGQSTEATNGSNTSFHGDLDAALINSSPDEDMAILDQLLELQQGESDYENDQANTENAINKVDEELDEQEKLLGKLRGR